MADSKTLQLPLLPDPGKHDDILVPTEKLDFAVRLGTSLARGHAVDERTVRKELSLKIQPEHPHSRELTPSPSRRSTPSQSPRKAECDGVFLSPPWSRRPTPSPRNFEGNKVFQFPTGFQGSKASIRRGSKQNLRQVTEEVQKIHKITRKETRDGRHFVSKENRRQSRKESRTNIRQTTMLHTYITDTETARAKLLRIFHTVRIISGICLALKKYVQQYQSKTWSFMEMYLHVKEDLSKLVVFNPQNFSRVEPESGKLRRLLLIPKQDRSADHVKVILALMRGNKSFQDYPSHVQIQLSLCMEYQSYEARRVILKQGHRPEAFYILIAGQVIANIEETSPTTGRNYIRTVTELGPGDTFGEIALIDGGRRTASIVCKTNVELLVVMKDDFDNIIRGPLVRQIEEHVGFCK